MTFDAPGEGFDSCRHCGLRTLPLQMKSPSEISTPTSSLRASTAQLQLTPRHHQTTAILNVRVFDGYKVGSPSNVIIDGDRIVTTAKAFGAHQIDAEGGVLIPGLIDSHCHIDNREKLKTLRAYGVTTALDMEEWPLSIVHDLKAVAGKNGYPDYFSAGLAATSHFPFPYPSGRIPSAAKAGQWVADRVLEGSDYIKVIAENPFLRQPDVKELAAVVAAAHDFRKLTIAHSTSIKGHQTAQAAKADFITHAPLDVAVDEDFAKTMVAERRCAIPTLVMMKQTADAKQKSKQGPEVKGTYDYSMSSKSVKVMHDAGVPILAGDDHNTKWFTPAQPECGSGMHEELKLLVEAGLTPTEALRAATVTPAQRFKLWDRGAIIPGLRADLILLKEDPTEDISKISTIKSVWCAGVQWQPEESLLADDSYISCEWNSRVQE